MVIGHPSVILQPANFTLLCYLQKLQDDLQKLGLKIKHHENNLKFLKNQSNKLDDSILEMQGGPRAFLYSTCSVFWV